MHGSGVSHAKPQNFGTRTCVTSFVRFRRFKCVLAAIFTFNALVYFIILSDLGIGSGINNSPSYSDYFDSNICSSRQQRRVWNDITDRHFNNPDEELPSLAAVFTVSNGFWDVFVNLYHRSRKKVADLLIVIADDSAVHSKLNELPQSRTIVLPGYDPANEAGMRHEPLAAVRAGHLLDLLCSFEGNGAKKDLTLVYLDTTTMRLKSLFPFPHIQDLPFGSNNDTKMQRSKHDVLAVVDDQDCKYVTEYNCTGESSSQLLMSKLCTTISCSSTVDWSDQNLDLARPSLSPPP